MSTNPTVAQRLAHLRAQYPGLIPQETLVANSWMAQYGPEYDGFQFNLRLGVGDDPGAGYPDYARQMAILNSQLRLDAVAWSGLKPGYTLADDTSPKTTYAENPVAVPTIIEFKRRAATAAVSQLVAYSHLWATDFGDERPPNLLLVANTASATIMPILPRAGITLVLVSADFSVLRRTSSYTPPVAPAP